MTTLPKTLLAVSVTGIATGSIINFGGLNLNSSWRVALPLGAVCFGLFLISFMLEKEIAGFDEEEARKWQWPQRNTSAPVPKQKSDAQPTIIQLKEEHL
jgi:hypothetical protein